MGKLVIKREHDIFQSNIDIRQDKINIDYSIFFGAAPKLVTYYNLNVVKSLRESTLDDVVGVMGNDSPLTYDRIIDLPLYELSGIEGVNETDTDFGKESNTDGTAVIIPNTVEPYEGDYFEIMYGSTSHIFNVKKVEFDKYSSKRFYRIEFVLASYDVAEINKKTTDEYITDYDYLGTEYKPIISRDNTEIVDFLRGTFKSMIKFVEEEFFYSNNNILYCNIANNKVYDPLLNKFAMDNLIFRALKGKDILDTIYLNDIAYDEYYSTNFIKKPYKNTLFYALETKTHTNLSIINYGVVSSPSFDNEIYLEQGTMFLMACYFSPVTTYNLFDSQLINNIKTNTRYGVAGREYEDIVINYINGTEVAPRELINSLKMLEFDEEPENLIKIITIMFIIKELYNKLLK